MYAADKPSYQEVVEALAIQIRELARSWSRGQARKGHEVFHHKFSSEFQLAASVLYRLGILETDTDVAYSFTCDAGEYRSMATTNRSAGPSYETVVMTLIGVKDYGKPAPELFELLLRVGVYELRETAMMQEYDRLRKDWVNHLGVWPG